MLMLLNSKYCGRKLSIALNEYVRFGAMAMLSYRYRGRGEENCIQY